MNGRQSGHANARIAVQDAKAAPYDQRVSPTLVKVTLRETFTGDIRGKSTVRALQVLHDDGSATMVSVQRFDGRLAGREGTFVLQGAQIIDKGRISATWFVVPRSGTGQLKGLRGDGGFEGEFGQGSVGTLDYWFE